METITCNIRDLPPGERSAAETLVGHRLSEDQQLVIQVRQAEPSSRESPNGSPNDELPSWCDVYAGLSDEQIAHIEKSIVRTPTSGQGSERLEARPSIS